MNAISHMILATAICGASVNLCADDLPTIIDQCPRGYTPAVIDVALEISTNMDCPLLEEPKLRKLVEKFGPGSIFAYPAIPGTCVSGEYLEGTIRLLKTQQVIHVEGFSESAQRMFVEAEVFGNPLSLTGIADTSDPQQPKAFASGAAMTIVALKGIDSCFNLNLVLADRFTLDYSGLDSGEPVVSTEDFLVVGARGDLRVTGRLKGTAYINALPGEPLVNEPFSVSGTICVK